MFFFHMIMAIAMFVVHSVAQAQFRFCAGADNNSNYTRVVQDVMKICAPAGVTLVFQPDSMTAMESAKTKKCDGFMVQGDIRDLYVGADPAMGQGQATIFGAHLEAYHFIAPREVKVGMFSTKQVSNTNHLADLKIGTTRSGAVSLKNYMNKTGLVAEVVSFASFTEVQKAIQDKVVSAGLLVTGANSPAIEGIATNLQVIGVSAEHKTALLKANYAITKVSYAGRTSGPIEVPATRAYAMLRSMSTGPAFNIAKEISKCVISRVGEFQSSSETSPVWEVANVNASATGTALVK